METRHKPSWWRAAAPLCVVVIVLAGLAPTPVVVTDNFNNNAINNTLWLQRQHGGVTLAETNQRLEFSANGATGQESYAFLEVRNWGAKWRYDFEIETRFRLNVNFANPNTERNVQLGIALTLAGELPDNFTGYVAFIVREGGSRTLVLIGVDGANDLGSDEVDITAIDGKLTLEYDRSNDRIEARIGNKSVHLDGVWSQFGASHGNDPMVITIGCLTSDGNVTFPGTKVYLDAFKFTGVKKARP